MGKKIRVWNGTVWEDVAPSLPYTAIHSAQASMPATGVDGQVWLDTDGTLAGQDFVPLSGGTMTGNLNTPSINSGPIVGRNKIINGDFGIWQRGATSATAGGWNYFADRWQTYNYGGTYSPSRQNFTPGTAPVAGYEGQYFLRINCTSTFSTMATTVEDVRTLAGQTATLSFWAKSNTAGPLKLTFAQGFGSGGSAAVDIVTQQATIGTLSTSWQRYTFTTGIPSVSGKTIGAGSFLFLQIFADVSKDLDVWGVQLEAGNQATPYHNATPNQQTELAACQRYYYRAIPGISTYGLFEHFGVAISTTTIYSSLKLPVTMRTNPSSVDFSTLRTFGQTTGVYNSISNVTINSGGDGSTSPQLAMLLLTSTGLTTNAIYGFGANNSTSAYIGVSAEL